MNVNLCRYARVYVCRGNKCGFTFCACFPLFYVQWSFGRGKQQICGLFIRTWPFCKRRCNMNTVT